MNTFFENENFLAEITSDGTKELKEVLTPLLKSNQIQLEQKL